MRSNPSAAVRDRTAHDDELGKILVQRAEAVVNPGTNGGELALQNMTAGMELQLGSVIVVRGPHRPHHGDVIDAVAHVRPPIADFQAAAPALSIADLHGEDLRMHLVQPRHQLAKG